MLTALFENIGMIEGTFLVRQKTPTCHALDVIFCGKVTHHIIHHQADGSLHLDEMPVDSSINTLEALVMALARKELPGWSASMTAYISAQSQRRVALHLNTLPMDSSPSKALRQGPSPSNALQQSHEQRTKSAHAGPALPSEIMPAVATEITMAQRFLSWKCGECGCPNEDADTVVSHPRKCKVSGSLLMFVALWRASFITRH